MTAAHSSPLSPAAPARGAAPPLTLALTAPGRGDPAAQLGHEAYSYAHVRRAFRPLLDRLGSVIEVDRPESRLDYALRDAQQRGDHVAHLAFMPLHEMYLSSSLRNLAFPFWEFPDLPDSDLGNNPRHNWLRIAQRLSGVLCASRFTREVFERAGVRTPLHLVPVPVADDYFALPAWNAAQRVHLDCPAYLLSPSAGDVRPSALTGARLWTRMLYERRLQPRMPRLLDRALGAGVRTMRVYQQEYRAAGLPPPDLAALQLNGVVYTAFVNPFDPRKNWQDLLSAFLIALRDVDDATLVLKLVVSPALAAGGLRRVIDHYRALALPHRCRVLCVTAYLSPAQMLTLARATTYGLSASRAESAGLPLQDGLASGRPVVAPAHTALAEYVDGEVGFPVASHPEPAAWPHDPAQRMVTTWQRIVWDSLREQIAVSHRVATADAARYARMAGAARARLRELAGAERVWPRLCAALDRDDGAAAG
jgi:glycosyltransferase involved in cell wall biosynthesis